MAGGKGPPLDMPPATLPPRPLPLDLAPPSLTNVGNGPSLPSPLHSRDVDEGGKQDSQCQTCCLISCLVVKVVVVKCWREWMGIIPRRQTGSHLYPEPGGLEHEHKRHCYSHSNECRAR